MKHGNPERLLRLARFMLRVSGGGTFAPLSVIVRHEITAALSKSFSGRLPVPGLLRLLGRGIRHASGYSLREPRLPSLAVLDAEERARLEPGILYRIEESMLSGLTP